MQTHQESPEQVTLTEDTWFYGNGYGPAMFIYFVMSHQFERASYLVALGVDVHAVDANGDRAIDVAVLTNNCPAVNFLLQFKPDVHLKTLDGKSAVEHAVKQNYFGIIDLFVEYTGRLDEAQDDFGRTIDTELLDVMLCQTLPKKTIEDALVVKFTEGMGLAPEILASLLENPLDEMGRLWGLLSARYEFCLMSELPDESPENAVAGKIYLSSDGIYCVRDPKGIVQRSFFFELDVDLNDLTNLLHDRVFQMRFLNMTRNLNHTIRDNLFSANGWLNLNKAELQKTYVTMINNGISIKQILTKEPTNLNNAKALISSPKERQELLSEYLTKKHELIENLITNARVSLKYLLLKLTLLNIELNYARGFHALCKLLVEKNFGLSLIELLELDPTPKKIWVLDCIGYSRVTNFSSIILQLNPKAARDKIKELIHIKQMAQLVAIGKLDHQSSFFKIPRDLIPEIILNTLDTRNRNEQFPFAAKQIVKHAAQAIFDNPVSRIK